MNEGPDDVSISVGDLVGDASLGLHLEVEVGREGLERLVRHNRIQRVGLVLAGHLGNVVPDRVQVCGETEIGFCETLPAARRVEVLQAFFGLRICCVVITCGFPPPAQMADLALRTCTPVIGVDHKTGAAIQSLEGFLDDRLAPRAQVHGVLIDVFGVGVLLMGESGVGKSECALDLVLRGHRLVADDVVVCDFRPPGAVFGSPAGFLRHHIEVRGLGVLNIQSLFGVTAVRDRKRIDVIVHLREDADEIEYDRIGAEDRYHHLLGVPVRKISLPVRPGRDMAAIIEIAARDELSRRAGVHSARDFLDSIERRLRESAAQTNDSILPTSPWPDLKKP
jgi:HPr kinase/phosphorylase